MTDSILIGLIGGLSLVVVLFIVVLYRMPNSEDLLNDLWQGMSSRLQLTDSHLARIEGSLGTMSGAQEARLRAFTQAMESGTEALRSSVDQKLAQTFDGARDGRGEIATIFTAFERRLAESLESLAKSNRQTHESLKRDINGQLSIMATSLGERLTSHGIQVAHQMAASQDSLVAQMDALTQSNRQMMTTSQDTLAVQMDALTQNNRQILESLKSDMGAQFASVSTSLRLQLDGNGALIRNQLSSIQESVANNMSIIVQSSQQNAEHLRATLNERLQAIQADNSAKVDEMRRTVDEKLHATLEHRLGQSFQIVSDRLEQVHRGLGEMQTLAAGVNDLKRVFTNVRARGIWGEVQLEAIIEQILIPEQFAKNVVTRAESSERVEIAIRLPGRKEEQPVWLPIDAKFPLDEYVRLMEAHDQSSPEGIEAAAKAIETRLRAEAKRIRMDYIDPPHTTDFAIMYLPAEGLYAEFLRRPGLSESIQREERVVVSGPTNLAAILNSLQMGFRTLAIEKRSAEVWGLLGGVKAEFMKLIELMDATGRDFKQTSEQFDQIGVRTRAIQRKLRAVEAMPTVSQSAMPELASEESPDFS